MTPDEYRKAIAEALSLRCYEPTPRLHDVWAYHKHRFPIKGGISAREVIARTIMKNNTFLEYIKRG